MPVRSSQEQSVDQTPATDAEMLRLGHRHLRFGWWCLWAFLSLGIILEALHGLKVGWYLDVAHSMRRLSWTLAHAHGTLLAIVNLVFGATLHRMPHWAKRSRRLASDGLLASTLLLPLGFFLGGLFPHEGDPGVGILLVPVGGGLLVISVLLIALNGRFDSRS
jgi:hypothetical protein